MLRPQEILMPMHMLELRPYISDLEFQTYVAPIFLRRPKKVVY